MRQRFSKEGRRDNGAEEMNARKERRAVDICVHNFVGRALDFESSCPEEKKIVFFSGKKNRCRMRFPTDVLTE